MCTGKPSISVASGSTADSAFRQGYFTFTVVTMVCVTMQKQYYQVLNNKFKKFNKSINVLHQVLNFKISSVLLI